MGYIAHDAVIVTAADHRPGGLPDIEAFRQSMPKSLRSLVIGPIPAAMNFHVSYVFLPDGSKEGWDTSNKADEWRDKFKDLFRFVYDDGSSPDKWVHVRFGGDADYDVDRLIEAHPQAGGRL